jgi:hypothetical protein
MNDNFLKLTNKKLLDLHQNGAKKKTFGYTNTNPGKREVGEIWNEYDAEGNVTYIWEQKEGYRVKRSANYINVRDIIDNLYTFNSCSESCQKRQTKEYNRLDYKYQKIYSMCTECAIEFETNLKVEGRWEDFQRSKMLNNAIDFFKDADHEIKEAAERLNKVEFVNEVGGVEKWTDSTDRKNNKAEEMVSGYEMYKKLIIDHLKGQNDEIAVI